MYPGSAIHTGSRLVKMSLEGVILNKLRIHSYPCCVWYRDQPQSCNICEDPAHRAASCPLRGLCRKCRQPGHVERGCPGSPPSASAPSPPAAPDVDVPAVVPVVPPGAPLVAPPVLPVPAARRAVKHLSSEIVAVPAAKSAALATSDASSDSFPPAATDLPLPDSSDTDDGSSDSSDDSVPDDVMASGDEEVLAAAGAVTSSPCRTCSPSHFVPSVVRCDETEDYVFGYDLAQDARCQAAVDEIDFEDLTENCGYSDDTHIPF